MMNNIIQVFLFLVLGSSAWANEPVWHKPHEPHGPHFRHHEPHHLHGHLHYIYGPHWGGHHIHIHPPFPREPHPREHRPSLRLHHDHHAHNLLPEFRDVHHPHFPKHLNPVPHWPPKFHEENPRGRPLVFNEHPHHYRAFYNPWLDHSKRNHFAKQQIYGVNSNDKAEKAETDKTTSPESNSSKNDIIILSTEDQKEKQDEKTDDNKTIQKANDNQLTKKASKVQATSAARTKNGKRITKNVKGRIDKKKKQKAQAKSSSSKESKSDSKKHMVVNYTYGSFDRRHRPSHHHYGPKCGYHKCKPYEEYEVIEEEEEYEEKKLPLYGYGYYNYNYPDNYGNGYDYGYGYGYY